MIECIGMIIVASYLLEILYEIYKCLQPAVNIKKKYGEDCWALVTGSTDGIGKAYCQILAKQNVNLCLIARNEQKVKEVIKELEVGSKSKFQYVIADFNECDQQNFYETIYKQVKGLDIGLLINNVGLSVKQPLLNHNNETLKNIIKVNCFAIVLLTKKLLPIMKQRKRSAIINLSSMAGRLPVPFHQTYSGTKAFDDFFSRSLNSEIDNIDIFSHRPLFVTTAITNYETKSGAISPQQCAQGGLNRLGLESASHGHWYHRLQGVLIARILPQAFRYYMIKRVIKQKIRK